MKAIQYFTDRAYAVVVVVGISIFLSYALTDRLGRLAVQPVNMVDLAGEQLENALLIVVVGATLGAVMSARHRRRSGRDHWVTASRSPVSRAGAQLVAIAIPVCAAWIIFVLVTSSRSGTADRLPSALALIIVSLLATCIGAAYGQVLGSLLPRLVAAPVAFISSYLGTALVAGAGDDSWWQWLGPGFGDSFNPRPKVLWLVGESAWFAGLILALLAVVAVLGARPRTIPRMTSLAAVILLVAGAILLAANGPDADVDAPPTTVSA